MQRRSVPLTLFCSIPQRSEKREEIVFINFGIELFFNRFDLRTHMNRKSFRLLLSQSFSFIDKSIKQMQFAGPELATSIRIQKLSVTLMKAFD